MNSTLRAAAALSLISVPTALLLPLAAQDAPASAESSVDIPAATQVPPATPDIPAPIALQPEGETPWIYENSNVPVDEDWLFGRMDNGLRYAVRRNGVPPQAVSIRVRIDVGSLYETDEEQGYAHLLEHLLFRESTYLGQAEAIAAWQRMGATFGADTNAEASPTHTALKIDIPDIDRNKLYESFKMLSGMVRGPVLNDENVAAELPIVLAEKRERGGAGERVGDLTRQTLFAGQRLASRAPIGLVETLEAANGAKLQAFHDRWYRPENVVIAVVGDEDPLVLAGLVEQWFGDWQGTGEPGIAPDFGDPIAPPGALITAGTDLPVGDVAIGVEPDLARNLTFAVLRPWRQVADTIEYNEGKTIDTLALGIINRRLEMRARAGASFLVAQASKSDVSRSTRATFVQLRPADEDWQSALGEVRAIIADAVATPPTQEEIDREASEMEINYVNYLEQARVQSGRELADSLIGAVDIRETVASPQVFLDVFRSARAKMTPEEVHARTIALFSGDVVRSVYITPSIGEADQTALQLALASEVEIDTTARFAASDISFDELPPIGTKGSVASLTPLGILDIEQVAFSNGTRALLWANDAEPGRVTVRVRFGAGYRAFDESNAEYATLGEAALMRSGIGDLGIDEIERLATGRKFGLEFEIEDAVFAFTAQSRSEDVADQLYLFAAKLGMPGWDPAPLARAQQLAQMGYNSFSASPSGVLARDLEFILSDEDQRFALPTPEQLAAATPEKFREVWEPLLKQGDIEVLVFGQFDRDAIIDKLAETFGALPPREPIPPAIAARVPAFPAANPSPQVLSHRGDDNQAAAVVSWPSGAGIASIRESRQLEILVQIFQNRLYDSLREAAGATYAPQIYSDWPTDVTGGGKIVAVSQLEPDFVPIFFAEAERIAAELVTTPPTADEINRVTEPLAQRVRRSSTGNQFWLYNLEGASYDPQRVELLRSLLADYSQTSPRIMQFLAQRYFSRGAAVKVAVLPEGQQLAEAPVLQDVYPAAPPSPPPQNAVQGRFTGDAQGPELEPARTYGR
ncbi:MAG: insulinase family protein [Pseudomonadota bacterium]